MRFRSRGVDRGDSEGDPQPMSLAELFTGLIEQTLAAPPGTFVTASVASNPDVYVQWLVEDDSFLVEIADPGRRSGTPMAANQRTEIEGLGFDSSEGNFERSFKLVDANASEMGRSLAHVFGQVFAVRDSRDVEVVGPTKPPAARPDRLGRRRRERAAKGESRFVALAQRSVRAAGITDRQTGGRGSVLEEPVLVFVGTSRDNFCVFDQDAREIGFIVHSEDRSKAARRYALRNANGSDLVVVERPASEPSLFGFAPSVTYQVRDAHGREIATVGRPSVRLHPLGSLRLITHQDRTLGTFKHYSWRSNDYFEDETGSQVARIFKAKEGERYVSEVDLSATEILRTLAVVATIVCQDLYTEGGAG